MRWALLVVLLVPAGAAMTSQLGDTTWEDADALQLGSAGGSLFASGDDAIWTWATAPFNATQRFSHDAHLELALRGSSTARIAVLMVMDSEGNMSPIGSAQSLSPGRHDGASLRIPVAGEVVAEGQRVALLLRVVAPQGVTLDGAASRLELPLLPYVMEATAPPDALDAARQDRPAQTAPVPEAQAVEVPGWAPPATVLLILLAGGIGLIVYVVRSQADKAHWEPGAVVDSRRDARHHVRPEETRSTAERLAAPNLAPVRRPAQDRALQEVQAELVEVMPAQVARGVKREKGRPGQCHGTTQQGRRCKRGTADGSLMCISHADQPVPSRKGTSSDKTVGPWAH